MSSTLSSRIQKDLNVFSANPGLGLLFVLKYKVLAERQSALSERCGASSERVENIRETRYWGELQVQLLIVKNFSLFLTLNFRDLQDINNRVILENIPINHLR